MATYRELIYIVNDEIKTISDDSIITEEHIKFLLQKYRAFLMYQKYKSIKERVPESAYQSICLNLEKVNTLAGVSCSKGVYLRSIDKIPTMLGMGNPSVYPQDDYFQGNITYVPRERMKYVGHNKYLQKIIYCALSPNGHLYFKSSNPQFIHLEKVSFTGVFENPEEAANLSCGSTTSTESCDILDKEFPIEEAMIPMLIEAVVKELSGVTYKPEDSTNDASDDLASLATFIARNAKSSLAKQIDQS